MSLFGSLSAGVAGLLSQGEAISVVSDNLSNVNTIGYKTNRTLFKQLVTSSGISGTAFNAGGVGTSVLRAQNAQGALQSSQSSTDLALSGNGFFVVTDTAEIDADTSTFYTRAGAFVENNRGFLVTPSGEYLQGWRTDSTGTIQDIQNPESVELQSVGSSAAATTSVSVGGNFNSEEQIFGYDTTLTFQQNLNIILADPTQADFVIDMRVFDAQGAARDVSVSVIKRAPNQWDWHMYTDGANLLSDEFGNLTTAGANAQVGSGRLFFDGNGSLKFATNTTLSINWSGGVPNGDITLDFGDFTGGFIFDDPLPASGLEFGDDYLAFNFDETDPNAPATTIGNYVLTGLAGNDIQLQEPDGTLHVVTVPTTAANRTLDFGNGVSITVSANWTHPGVGAIGTLTMGIAENAQDVGRGTDGIVQLASSFNTSFINQDGFGSGTLAAVSVDDEGFVIGNFTNGESKKLFKLSIAVFANPAELEALSDNLMRETDGSGAPLFKEAGVGGTANVVSGALESSTVDIAGEFSKLIVSQRAFQASSSVITTADQMLNELLQIR